MPPVSPSRRRADWYRDQRRYFREWTAFDRAFFALGAILLFVSIAWAATWFARMPGRTAPFTHGPLAQVHAAWENDCAACHVPHEEGTDTGLLSVQDRWRDFTCRNCHADAVHHTTANWGELDGKTQQQCAVCHRDHQGREHSLVQLADASCTQCHEKLTEHAFKAPNDVEPEIRSFAARDPDHPVSGEHPEFRFLREGGGSEEKAKEIRHLKFRHSLHMTPGITRGTKESNSWKIADIEPEFQDHYRSALHEPNATPVQLRCDSCHRADGGRSGNEAAAAIEGLPSESARPARAAGAHMLPINFDLHCKGCHTPRLNNLGAGTKTETVRIPHRVQPGPLDDWLKQKLMEVAIVKRPDPERKPLEVIGGRVDPLHRESTLVPIEEAVAIRLKAVNNDLYGEADTHAGSCSLCHPFAPGRKSGERADAVVSPGIPSVWFKKARFSHVAHRALACRECHADKDAARSETGETLVDEDEFEPVRIEGIRLCRECHSPRTTYRDKATDMVHVRGGVRDDCTLCHSYHNGDNPLQGPGAPDRSPFRDPQKGLTVEEMLRGHRP